MSTMSSTHAGAWRHDHPATIWPRADRALVRENCGACVLGGYCRECERQGVGCPHQRLNGPNYAGWARLYVESGRKIPHQWRDAFNRELERTDNPDYVAALRADVETYGVRFDDE